MLRSSQIRVKQFIPHEQYKGNISYYGGIKPAKVCCNLLACFLASWHKCVLSVSASLLYSVPPPTSSVLPYWEICEGTFSKVQNRGLSSLIFTTHFSLPPHSDNLFIPKCIICFWMFGARRLLPLTDCSCCLPPHRLSFLCPFTTCIAIHCSRPNSKDILSVKTFLVRVGHWLSLLCSFLNAFHYFSSYHIL